MTLPLASETVEVLWVLEDDSHYWWSAVVLDIKDVNKGSILATATLQYKPGPNIHESTVQRVKFRKDYTVSCISRQRGDPPDHNTWRFPIEDGNCDSDGEVYQETSCKKSSERISDETEVNAEDTSSVVPFENNKFLEKQGKVISYLEKGLESALERLSVVESLLDGLRTPSPVNISSMIISDLKSFLRRGLVEKFMVPVRSNIQKQKNFTSTNRLSSLSCKINCSLRMFQLLATDVLNKCSKEEENALLNVSFIPSRLAISHASHSVPSFHIKLRSFKQICDYLEIRDLNDREQFITKTSVSSSGTDCFLRVIGTFVYGRSTERPILYLIGNDYSLPSCIEEYCILYREGSSWDEENNRFVHGVKYGDDSYSIDNFNVDDIDNSPEEFNLTWNRSEDLKSKTWSKDAVRNPDSQLGELELTIPVILLSGKTAIEIDSYLTKSFTDKVLISSTTSFPPAPC